MENICENLMELFQKNKRIDEEQVHIFFEGAADCLNGRMNEDKTIKLDKLTTYLQKKVAVPGNRKYDFGTGFFVRKHMGYHKAAWHEAGAEGTGFQA